MKATFGRLASLALVASAVATLAAGALAQEKVKIQKIEADGGAGDGEGRLTVVVNREHGEHGELPGYWVGIGGEAAGEALLAQLKLEAGLVVHDVIDDGPAAKAGVQKHDIVLKFGERKVGAIDDLVEALRGSKGEEIEVVLLRGGEKKTVKIQPEKRPAGSGHDAEHHETVRSWLMKLGEGEGGQDMRLFSFRPGMVLGHAQAIQLPGNTSITIRKESEGPAKIEVTHDGQTYQVTDDNLKELPENLRGPIEKMLKGGNQMLHFEHQWPAVPEHLEKQLRVRIHGAEDKEQAKDGDKNVEDRHTIIVPRVRVEAAAAAAAGKSIEAQLEMLLRKIEKIEKELSTLKDK